MRAERQKDGPNDEHSRVLGKLVALSPHLKIDLPADGVAQVDLPVEQVGESGRA